MTTNSHNNVSNRTNVNFSPWFGSHWDKILVIGSCFLAGWLLFLWLLPHWDYLPDWFPVLPPHFPLDILKCFQPVILCVLGIPTLFALVIGIITNLVLIISRVKTKRFSSITKLTTGLIILSFPIYAWLFGSKIDNLLVNYAISRYDVVINAIEQYRFDNGQYPPDLEALVPDYLPTTPGIYMKYGEYITYEPKPSAWYDHAPFTFELDGNYAGIHGQTLKYCPVEVEPCYEGDRHYSPHRINNRWIWVYSSAL